MAPLTQTKSRPAARAVKKASPSSRMRGTSKWERLAKLEFASPGLTGVGGLDNARPPERSRPRPAKDSITTILAKIDVGVGNKLFIRGSGAGLTWDRGIPMHPVKNGEWVVIVSDPRENFAFKVLLNDKVWSEGSDYVAAPGDLVAITPKF